MAVSDVRLVSTGASGAVEGTDISTAHVTYSSTYFVKCDDAQDSPATVLQHFLVTGSLPFLGRTYRFGNDFDTTAVCKSIRPAYIDGSGGMFSVGCEFADPQTEEQQKNPNQNGKQTTDPLEWLPEIDVSFGTYSKPVEYATFLGAKNADGLSPHLKIGKFLPVMNSALQPFDPTFEEQYSFKIIRFTKNVKTYDDDFYNKYQDAINKAETTIKLPRLRFKTTIAKHYGKLNVSASLNFNNGVLYWKRTLELHIKGWDREILDRGTVENYRVDDQLPDQTTIMQADIPTGRTSVDIVPRDREDIPLSEPFNLDGKGKRLKEGKPPVSLAWRTFDEADFSKIDW